MEAGDHDGGLGAGGLTRGVKVVSVLAVDDAVHGHQLVFQTPSYTVMVPLQFGKVKGFPICRRITGHKGLVEIVQPGFSAAPAQIKCIDHHVSGAQLLRLPSVILHFTFLFISPEPADQCVPLIRISKFLETRVACLQYLM